MNYLEKINQIDRFINEISLLSNEEYNRTVKIYKNPLYLSEYKKLLYNGLIQHFSLTGFKEIKNIYLGLYFREETIKYKSELGGYFFNKIYFERNIIFHLNVVINRIATLLCVRYLKIDDKHAESFDRAFNKIKKEEDFKNSKIKDNILKIKSNKYFNTIVDIRKHLDHGIDPYFTDINMVKSFDTKNILVLIKLCYETIKLIYDEHIAYTPKLEGITVEILKMKRHGDNVFVGIPNKEDLNDDIQNFNYGTLYFTEAVSNYADKVSPFLESIPIEKENYGMVKLLFLIISDITFKYNNLVRSYMYGIGLIPKQVSNLDSTFSSVINDNNYDYFINMSYVILYSIYDKLGFLFSRIYTTPKDKTYFKNIIEWILSEKNKFPNIFGIEEKLENLINGDNYKMLDRVRQNYIHGYDYMIQQEEGLALDYKYMILLLHYNIEDITEFLRYLIYDYIPKETSFCLSNVCNLNYIDLLNKIIGLIDSRNPYFNEKNIINFEI